MGVRSAEKGSEELPSLATVSLDMRMDKGVRILSFIVLPLLPAGAATFPLVVGNGPDGLGTLGLTIFSVLFLAGLVLTIVGLRDALYERVVIKNGVIRHTSTFTNRTLRFDEIRGYRRTDMYLYLEPRNADLKRVKVHKYYQYSDFFEALLSRYFPDLDVLEPDNQLETTLDSSGRGLDEKSREALLRRAKITSYLLNGSGIAVGAAGLFIRQYYEVIMWALVLLPLICLLTVIRYKGLIRMNSYEKSRYPSILYAYFIPVPVIGLRVVWDYNVIQFKEGWYIAGLWGFMVAILLMTGTDEFSKKTATDYMLLSVMALFSAAYMLAASLFVNCYYDHSQLEKYAPVVIDKRIGKGKYTSYHLTLEPWGPLTSPEEVNVGSSLYQATEVGDSVHVEKGVGLLGMPWYQLPQN
ncbi:hypothetical protein AB9P05_01245 [Roseivirga sp. BDSF3-8]|uniref:hypothetical protein n=1 Tax=Roseivirga sp. BDSF3-8 TaxID=3241598 RepID=UPI003531DE19